MSWAIATGAGKDATQALHRARAQGLKVEIGVNLYDVDTGRVRFHGTPITLVQEHAKQLGLELVSVPTTREDFAERFLDTLQQVMALGCEGMVFGNIHLADVRAWYQERVEARGLVHLEPLWQEPPSDLVRGFLDLGYRATVVGVDLSVGDRGWLGRELDLDLVAEVEASGCDACGEHGEYHTFVWDGPEFRGPVPVRTGVVVEDAGHAQIDLMPRTVER